MKLGMTISGGGTRVISRLLENGGASSWFSFADVPYSKEASFNVLGFEPIKYGSFETSDVLALSTFIKLTDLHPEEDNLKVLACSAVLYKEGQREDRENVAYISYFDAYIKPQRIKKINMAFSFSEKDRYAQELSLSDMLQLITLEDFKSIRYWLGDKIKLTHLDWKYLGQRSFE